MDPKKGKESARHTGDTNRVIREIVGERAAKG